MERLTHKDGRCVVMPCKVGDIFYTISKKRTECRFGYTFDEYSCQGCDEECDSMLIPVILAHKCAERYMILKFIDNRTQIYLNKEAAEATLKKR